MGIFRVGIVQMGVILVGNFLSCEFSEWELSGRNHPGGFLHSYILEFSLL